MTMIRNEININRNNETWHLRYLKSMEPTEPKEQEMRCPSCADQSKMYQGACKDMSRLDTKGTGNI
jgi:hypothetical protein